MQGIAMMPVNAQEVGDIEVEAAPHISTPATWYITSAGNLGTDKYALYPYEKDASLTIGFSRFGEMINTVDNVGLEYRTEDVFAPPAGANVPGSIPKPSWLQGWFINITYNHNVYGLRNVWAMAQHGDIIDYDGYWIRVDNNYPGNVGANGPINSFDIEANEDARDVGHYIDPVDPENIIGVGDPMQLYQGGRKTNGTAVSGPIEVLYDGPRRFVARVNTTIYDYIEVGQPGPDQTVIVKPLVHVIFTIDFNKVTKEVNVIKDIKIAEQAKFTLTPMKVIIPNLTQEGRVRGDYAVDGYSTVQIKAMAVSFSNRGEFDIEKATNYESFVHYYTYAASHPDDSNNDVLPTVYDNKYTLLRTMPPQTRLVDPSNAPLSIWGSEPSGAGIPKVDGTFDATYDVAQIISSTVGNTEGRFVSWAAFWPSVSDWDADGGNDQQWWQSLEANDRHLIDGIANEPFQSPYVIGEWDFFLSTEAIFIDPDGQIDGDEVESDVQFRGVTQYGLIDRHHELVFAEHITDFPIVTCETEAFSEFEESPTGEIEPSVLRSAIQNMEPFHLILGNVRYGGAYDENSEGNDWNVLDPEVVYYLKMKFCPWDLIHAQGKNTQRHLEVVEGPAFVSHVPLGVDFTDFRGTDLDNSDVIGDTTAEAEEWRTYSTFSESVVVDGVLLKRGVDYTINNIEGEAVVVLTPAVSVIDELDVYFSTIGAAYEWIAVGRDSDVVDSAAAASVTDAFTYASANIPAVLWSALDMKDNNDPVERSYITTQYLMQKFGAGNARTDYHYDHDNGDHRSALKMFWSTTIPIASSGIITVGGPGANLVTEYENEFVPAIYRGQFFGVNDLLLVSSWDAAGSELEKPPIVLAHDLSDLDVIENKAPTKYNLNDIQLPDQKHGWAVISTVKDINGTVFYAVWGATGNDSFWIAQALNNGLHGILDYKKSPLDIYKVIRVDANENGPSSDDEFTAGYIGFIPLATWISTFEELGVTNIVVVIDYRDNFSKDGGYHPDFYIVEELGTISEIPQHPDP